MNATRRANRGLSRSGGAAFAAGSARGFSVVEATIVIAIIALLAGIVLTAVRHVRRSGDIAAEVAEVAAFKTGVEQFNRQYGFLPPLVVDTTPANPNTGAISIWSFDELSNINTTLNGSTGPMDRHCYSQYTLPYYICGATDAKVDGVDGLGSTEPSKSHDGTFSKRGRKIDPFVDPSTHKTRTSILRLKYGYTGTSSPQDRVDCVILHRWSDGSGYMANDRPIRYYRWEPTYYTEPSLNQPNPAPNANLVGKVKDSNVPRILGDPATKPELRSAKYAIVSPGPDNTFGDEGNAFNQAATVDNIVEIGQ